MNKKFKYVVLGTVVFLPNALKIFIYNKFFGWEIDRTAKIGLSFIHAKKVKMGAYSKIRHLNIIRNLELLEMAENATIGNLNSVSALPLGSKKHFSHEKNRSQSLIIGKYGAIVKGHFFDCNNTITIGSYTIIAGFGSAFFTHSINVENNRQETAPIHLGNYCMVGAKSVITRGAILPDCSILAANSTLHKAFDKTHTLYSGVPAVATKKLNPDSKYFKREVGFVS